MIHNTLKSFPDGFLWGASTSAYQVEGASLSYGKGPSVMDMKAVVPGTTDFTVCSDHYHNYKEDIQLFADMGLKSYRFSIAWTRIYPDGIGEINEQGVEFYNNVINELIKHNIEPIVTIYHFDMPYALYLQGGWSNRSIISAFVKYSETLFSLFGDRVKHWLTINEQNIMILYGHIIGTKRKDIPNPLQDLYQQNHHMMLAQSIVFERCHKMIPDSKIGPAPNIATIYPASSAPEDIIAANNCAALRNWLYLDLAVHGRYNKTAWAFLELRGATPDIEENDMDIISAGKPDFIALNYYSTETVQYHNGIDLDLDFSGDQQMTIDEPGLYKGVTNKFLQNNQYGWGIDPIGFRITLRDVYERYNLPILITENGIAGREYLENDYSIHDDYRIEYLKLHLLQLQLAITDGVDVFGYSPWAAIDLVSTHQGYNKRYGFIYVDREEFDLKELKRYPKDSYYWYRDFIMSQSK
ncbi:glycoside hydrolase family 1 protein [Brenneria goodwinii]|uniref:glycoside hydrolase family 1 protein n=1 Tax=Brenneria goodwinii TaxID=1109412 RepID=UPI0036EA9DED